LQILQHVFAVVIPEDSFKELVKSKSLEDFVASQKLSYSVPNSTLVLIVFGKQSRNLFELSISLFDSFHTQLNYVSNTKEFAIYLAQITRSLAKMEKRLAHSDRLFVGVEKVLFNPSFLQFFFLPYFLVMQKYFLFCLY
ncbi:hypothetical protein OESDEN_12247, partial [Oesophagostomum dentatum]